MSAYQVTPTVGEHAIAGRVPTAFTGVDLPDGDAVPWVGQPVGTDYLYKPDETSTPVLYRKLKDDSRDDDWVTTTGGLGVITQRFSYTDFTDGGSTAGTLTLDQQVPQGAFVVRSVLENVTGFAGDTSAVIIVGDGTDTDRYNTGTPSVFATANAIDLGAVSGTAIHTAAKSVTVTITSGSDWGAVSAGAATLRIYYYK